jgi:hypothetical protein
VSVLLYYAENALLGCSSRHEGPDKLVSVDMMAQLRMVEANKKSASTESRPIEIICYTEQT